MFNCPLGRQFCCYSLYKDKNDYSIEEKTSYLFIEQNSTGKVWRNTKKKLLICLKFTVYNNGAVYMFVSKHFSALGDRKLIAQICVQKRISIN